MDLAQRPQALPPTSPAIIIKALCADARLPHGRHPAGLRDLTADLKKVADRFGAPMPEGEHLNAQHSTSNAQRPSVRIGDSDEERSSVWRPRYNIAPTQAG